MLDTEWGSASNGQPFPLLLLLLPAPDYLALATDKTAALEHVVCAARDALPTCTLAVGVVGVEELLLRQRVAGNRGQVAAAGEEKWTPARLKTAA